MNNQDCKSSNSNKPVLPEKRKYLAPKLTNYGHVTILTQSGAASVTSDSGSNGMRTGSDRSIKANIVAVGTHEIGIPLYLYDYKDNYKATCGTGKFLGVMADDVETVLPEAVSVHVNGYKQVDYGMLGVIKVIH